jgi:hypothetical protein
VDVGLDHPWRMVNAHNPKLVRRWLELY